MSKAHRLALVVLGMHRSGTSAMAGCLVRLGAGRPRTEIAPTINNPKGYFESEPVMAFNDRLLALMGSTWDDWRRSDCEALAGRGELAQEAAGLLADEFGEADIIVLKDPRLCRLMPLWSDFLERAGYEARYVLPVRQPLQSALSLRARNGFSLETGRRLWLRHVLEAEWRTRGQRRHIVASERLVADPETIMSAVAESLGVLINRDAMTAVGDFIEPALFHRDPPYDSPPGDRLIAELSERVHGALANTTAQEKELDDLYAEFNAISDASSWSPTDLCPASAGVFSVAGDGSP